MEETPVKYYQDFNNVFAHANLWCLYPMAKAGKTIEDTSNRWKYPW